ncbi:sensor histidine kinase [Thiohalomonas denitrificans]|nr:HAMP domain-containing sensor histidine kinase [Thiohalomonas denitrificans]
MNTELEEFAYIASHDLKAPLRAVANLSLVVAEDAGDRLDDENRRLLWLMRDRVTAMDALIDGLLRYARIGREARHPCPTEWSRLLGELVANLELPEGFRVEWEPTMPPMVTDPLELRQVLQNLIANAAHHHDRPEQGHAWVGVTDCGDHWLLEVADDGPGIPEHMRGEIFSMFRTGGAPGHTGIGLAVVRKIILANGGRIEVDGNTPRGAVFRIEWPKVR